MDGPSHLRAQQPDTAQLRIAVLRVSRERWIAAYSRSFSQWLPLAGEFDSETAAVRAAADALRAPAPEAGARA
jgi:hypothetical protein